jgi:hypothetical protein
MDQYKYRGFMNRKKPGFIFIREILRGKKYLLLSAQH